ncbi:MAG: BTAD domain-containing putative transcriptional regulator [Terriglobia bacterium]
MAELTLTLLGGYQGRRGDGHELKLPTKKGWGLISYLALHLDQPVSREKLAALLWGERFEEQARGSLRQTLYEVRTGLGSDLADRITATRATISLGGDGVCVDAQRFEVLAQSDKAVDLAAAAALYRGSLLEGLETGEPMFAEWLETSRAHYHEVACRTLETLARREMEQEECKRAIGTARRLVNMDPLSEPAHRLLMQALANAGRRSEALKHYQGLETLLHTELGVEPDGATQALQGSLLTQTAGGPGCPKTSAPGLAAMQATAVQPNNAARRSRGSAKRFGAVAGIIGVAISAGLFAWQPWTRTVEPAVLQDMAFPLPDKPSIAVLPFDNFSGDGENGLIAKGFTEDLITALSKVPDLFVISRVSTFALKDQALTATKIAEELGVRYIVEGSIQESGGKLRINAQLTDAVAGNHLWADNFDGESRDLFALQDDVVRRILVELQVTLTTGDHARVASRGTTNLDAWLLREQAMAELYKFTRESTFRTRELLQRAHEADPNWARPLGGLAFTYWYEARRGWTKDREGWVRKGVELAERAIEMDPLETLGYMQLGNFYQLKGDHERAIELREKAVEIAPNDFQANWGLGGVLFKAGQVERALEVLRHAERVSPRHPVSFTWTLSQAQLFAGHYEDAIETASRARTRAPDRDVPRIQLAAAYSALGRMDQAQGEAEELLRIDPKFTVSGWTRQLIDYKNRATVDKLANLLIQAGLPE